MEASVNRLHPTVETALPLRGLYMAHDLRRRASKGRPFVYSNFITSLDGRIATPNPKTHRLRPPPAIKHPHDWQLYLELAAQADAVVTSGRRLREVGEEDTVEMHCIHETGAGDLGAWRREHGLPPHPTCIVLTASLDLPLAALRERVHGDITILTSARPDAEQLYAIRKADVEVIEVSSPRVSGDDIRRLALERGYATLYSIGGPEVFHTLVSADLLDRLYLTFSLKLVSGEQFETMLRGPALESPMGFDLHEIYFEPPTDNNPPLLFTSLNRRTPKRS